MGGKNVIFLPFICHTAEHRGISAIFLSNLPLSAQRAHVVSARRGRKVKVKVEIITGVTGKADWIIAETVMWRCKRGPGNALYVGIEQVTV